jgi:hypothetical protein
MAAEEPSRGPAWTTIAVVVAAGVAIALFAAVLLARAS